MKEREVEYLERRGELVLTWVVTIDLNGFETKVFCKGTWTEVSEYLESELPADAKVKNYHAASNLEQKAIVDLKTPVYIAPIK